MMSTTQQVSRDKLPRPVVDPWRVSEQLYPSSGSAAEKLEFLLNFAILAPSSHNTQPWLFRLGHDYVDLLADRTRSLPVIDPSDRTLVISCGAALFHLRTAIRYFGNAGVVDLLPDSRDPDLLARVSLGEPQAPSAEEQQLFKAIFKRHTYRAPFADRPVDADVLDSLRSAAASEGTALRTITRPEDRVSVATLVAEGDRLQWSDKEFRQEMAAWITPGGSQSLDGVPGYALGFGELLSRAAPFVMRAFDLGKSIASKDSDLAATAPVVAVLSSEEDNTHGWLLTGQALSRLLLRATAAGLSASFLNQPIEVDGLRPVLRIISETAGYPQVMFRLGHGHPARPTPRRAVRSVTLHA